MLSITLSNEVTWQIRNFIYPLGLCPVSFTRWWLIRRIHYPQWSHGKIVTWQIKIIISIFTRFMATIFDKVMAYGYGPLRTKSHDSLFAWSYVVPWQIKNVICPFPQVLWTPNMTDGATTQKITPPIVKSSSHPYISFCLSNEPLILTTDSKRIGVTNISISKPLCDLKWNCWGSITVEFCITTFVFWSFLLILTGFPLA